MVKNLIAGSFNLPGAVFLLLCSLFPIGVSLPGYSSSLAQESPTPKPTLLSPKLLHSGTQVFLNGKTYAVAWSQWQVDGSRIHTAITDTGLTQLLGVELLNTGSVAKQPVQWFSQSKTTPFVLPSQHRGGYRYLDVTQLAKSLGWQLSNSGNTLSISTPAAKVKAIRQGRQSWGDRIVVDLDRPTPWQIRQLAPRKPALDDNPIYRTQEWHILLDASVPPALAKSFNPSPIQRLRIQRVGVQDAYIKKVETTQNKTTIRLLMPAGMSPRISTLPSPNRLVVDVRADAMVERNILWYPGLRWRQKFVKLGDDRFPVVWLEIHKGAGLTIKPIASAKNTLVGIAPLLQTAQRYTAAAAINAGFFNRNNKLPLGAIRRDGRWLSSPILNRGAIAWNDQGQFKIGRLNLQETLITSTGRRLAVVAINSGYVQKGIARYSSEWGSTYTPLSNNETIVIVQNNQVTAQLPGGAAGKTAFPIPANGYLLALRGNIATDAIAVGSLLSWQSTTQPAAFAAYPQILGAGPLLLQNRQIVLNAKAEGFSNAFIRQKAIRSAIGTTKAGTLLIAAVHNRAGGAGPTLAEVAKIMQQLGCVDALNLDGGSSTSLYLGGQLLNRSPSSAARVHNGLGVFLKD